MNPPGEMTGNAPLARWLNKLLRFAVSCRVTSVRGGRLNQGPGGTTIIIDGSRSIGAPAEVGRYKITATSTNYVSANPYLDDGTVDTGETVYIAKPPALRDADGERNRTVGSSTVVEEIRTNYAVNDDIYAIESSVPTGVVDGSSDPVTLIDLNVDARNWQPKFVEIEGCVDSVDKLRMAIVGTVYDPPA